MIRVCIITAIVLLGGCGLPFIQSDPATIQLSAEQQDYIDQRTARLSEYQQWYMSARINLRTLDDVLSGSVRWMRKANRLTVRFSLPLGGGGFVVEADDESATLRLSDGSEYQAERIDELLEQQLGLSFPADQMWFWLQGLPGPGNIQHLRLNDSGLLQQLDQDSWQVVIKTYKHYGTLLMPRKLHLRGEKVEVRLVVDSWQVKR